MVCPDAQISFAVIKHKSGVHHVMAEWSLKKHVDSVAKQTLGKKGSRSQLAVLAADAGQQRARSASTDASPGAVDLTSTAVEKLANGKREKVRPMPQLVRPWYIFSPRGWTVRHWRCSLLRRVHGYHHAGRGVLNSKLGGPAYEWALKEVQRANNVVDVVFGLDILLGFLGVPSTGCASSAARALIAWRARPRGCSRRRDARAVGGLVEEYPNCARCASSSSCG